MLSTFGFGKDYDFWISNLISYVFFFFILINGSPSHSFNPSRGIHRGDPISPFIYIIAAKGLEICIKTARDLGSMKGISLYLTTDPLSHLQFVDDTLLMDVPLVREALDFKAIFNTFMKSSSALINHSKSQVFFLDTSST
jgi:hypothetical protein